MSKKQKTWQLSKEAIEAVEDRSKKTGNALQVSADELIKLGSQSKRKIKTK